MSSDVQTAASRTGSYNVLMTGGTGFVGKAVLSRLLAQSKYDKIYLLVRPKQGQSPEVRVDQILTKILTKDRLAAARERVVAVPGELTAVGLGLSPGDLGLLKVSVHQILHIGANTDFGAPISEARRYNLEGTRHLLDVALAMKAEGVLDRFEYVSTAFVAGYNSGPVSEKDLARGQSFSNFYEQSKYEAELLLHEHDDRLDISIYRPSIVVGDSRSGYTPHFKVLYWPIQLMAKNILPFITGNPRARLDVVPIDFVADGLAALVQSEDSRRQTFLLTAGKGNEVRLGDVLNDAYQLIGIKRRPFIPWWSFNLFRKMPFAKRFLSPMIWDAVHLAQPYYHYLQGINVRFDASKTHALLAKLGVKPAVWKDYKHPVLRYCADSRWGKKPPQPEHVYYAV